MVKLIEYPNKEQEYVDTRKFNWLVEHNVKFKVVERK